ncbi:glycosyltransferase involved in cell wall biosynthesis [Paenibacillus anaericanus]|uniref:glycosyltransferase family 2 protein n=1 Tax=Paenibacillus anaericanus TaxID=170367 RepID=UPI002784C364|nr:glycosyltransferase family 2 protein [Paenibacillus anaericanus]MDQ0089970.1 glycosyltransferase involved in cell wall biosynthesis [Paenibacillus anaericanus]
MKILVIIPAYNEEGNLGALLEKMKQYGTDIVVVNDCSTDATLKVCEQHTVTYIDLPNNLGIGGAVQTGYQFAAKHNYDIAIQIDGDGQHNPEYISDLIKPIIDQKADMVIGSRYIAKEGFQSSFLRRVGIRHFSSLIRILLNKTITDPTSGFRACNKSVIHFFAKKYPADYPEPETIVTLLRNKLKVVEVPVIMNSRENGTSSINKLKSMYYMIKVSLAILIDFLRENNKEIA